MHGFITHMRAKEGKREEVIALTTVMLEKTQGEDGVPVYVFSTAADSPDDFWFYDIYESDEASKAHESSEEFARTMPRADAGRGAGQRDEARSLWPDEDHSAFGRRLICDFSRVRFSSLGGRETGRGRNPGRTIPARDVRRDKCSI